MDHMAFYERLTDSLRAGEAVAVGTITRVKGSAPNDVGAKVLIGRGGRHLYGTVGGGAVEYAVLQAGGEAIAKGQSRVFSAHLTDKAHGGLGMMCGGSVEVFLEVHMPATRLILCGAGHVSAALARLATGFGLRLTVLDDREDWANPQRYPLAELHLARPEAVLPSLHVDEGTFIVIATHGEDLPALVAAAATPARYIGVVASQRKPLTLLREAAALGADVEGLLPRLHAPIGLALGGRTPEAVALSILAEIHATLHGGDGRPVGLPAATLVEQLAKHQAKPTLSAPGAGAGDGGPQGPPDA